MTKGKRLAQVIFVIIALGIFITGLSYGSTLLFFKLNHLDYSLAMCPL